MRRAAPPRARPLRRRRLGVRSSPAAATGRASSCPHGGRRARSPRADARRARVRARLPPLRLPRARARSASAPAGRRLRRSSRSPRRARRCSTTTRIEGRRARARAASGCCGRRARRASRRSRWPAPRIGRRTLVAGGERDAAVARRTGARRTCGSRSEGGDERRTAPRRASRAPTSSCSQEYEAERPGAQAARRAASASSRCCCAGALAVRGLLGRSTRSPPSATARPSSPSCCC